MLQSRLVQILRKEAIFSSRKLRIPSFAASNAYSDLAQAVNTQPVVEEKGPSLPPQYAGKIVAKITNFPRFVLKHELLNLFPGCNLREADITTVVDEKVRIRHWRVCFNSSEDFQRGVAMIMQRRRLGPRLLKIEPESISELFAELDPNHPNRLLDAFRGDSLLMLNCPEDATTESVENFFENYFIAPIPFCNIRIVHRGVRTPLRKRVQGDLRPLSDVVERRTIVKFISPMEAFRALREKNREFLDSNAIDLRLIQ